MQNQLERIGLPPEQAALYVALVEAGKQTQSDLARATNTNRTSLNPHLKALLRAGLISQSRVGKRTVYYAEPPRKLERFVKEREQALSSVLPQLQEHYARNTHQPKTRLFLGEDGLRHIHQEIAETANYIKTVFAPEDFLSVLTLDDSRYFHLTIARREVPLKGLCRDTRKNRELVAQAAGEPTIKTRFMPPHFNFSVEVTIFNQQIVFYSWQNRFAVAIDSLEIRSYHAQLFDHFWQQAKQ